MFILQCGCGVEGSLRLKYSKHGLTNGLVFKTDVEKPFLFNVFWEPYKFEPPKAHSLEIIRFQGFFYVQNLTVFGAGSDRTVWVWNHET